MLSSLKLRQFCGLEDVAFENLGRVNLIIGGNNTGKTSILESLVLMLGSPPQVKALPTTFRAQPPKPQDQGQNFWRMLVRHENHQDFKVMGDEHRVECKEETDDVLRFLSSSPQDPNVRPFVSVQGDGQVGFSSLRRDSQLAILSTIQGNPAEISEMFNQIAPLNPKNESKLQDLLRNSVEPRLQRIRYARVNPNQTHLVYVDIGEPSMLPFTQLGQAFARTLHVYCHIFATRPRILLVDEIENGLYYKGLEDYWRGLMEVVEDQDVQLFATTHSRECMEAAHRAAKFRDDYPLRYLRLDRSVGAPEKILATTFGGEEMKTAIEFGREMR